MSGIVGVDWGTSGFRAWRLDAEGTILERRASRDGLRRAARRGFEKTLFRHIEPWLAPDTTVVLAMAIADRRDWVETPFLDAPLDIGRWREGIVRRRVREVDLRFLPGVAWRAAGETDAMRREAPLAFGTGGTGGAGRRLLLVPGTRSRWIRIGDDRIEAFRTHVGGELLASLLDGAFGAIVPAGGQDDTGAFIAGVERGYRSRHLVTDLFAERAALLLDERDPATARARLGGLLIGNEVREAEMALGATGEALTLLGPAALCAPHARALRHLGTIAVHDEAERAMVAGFVAACAETPSPSVAALPRPPPDATRAAERLRWDDALAMLPLVAALHDLEPARAIEIVRVLSDAGLRVIAVSDRAPAAHDSIARLADAFGGQVCIGVCDVADAARAAAAIDAGALAVIGHDTDAATARRCRKRGVAWVAGIATPSEARTALGLGAAALSPYPAIALGPRAVQAFARVLPPATTLLPYGGMGAASLAPYGAAGAAGVVLDTALYRPGAASEAVAGAARALVDGWRRVERARHLRGAGEREHDREHRPRGADHP